MLMLHAFFIGIGALIIVLPTVLTVTPTSRTEQDVSAGLSGTDTKEIEA